MKVGIITTPNEKGQIVIPKALREALGIHKDMPLNIVLQGKGMYISPIKEIVGDIDAEDSYIKILQKTRGTWGDEKGDPKDEKRKEMELVASQKRKELW